MSGTPDYGAELTADELLNAPAPDRKPADPNEPIIQEADAYTDFLTAYKNSQSHERFVLGDGTKRPAVKTGTTLGYDIWLTPTELAWDIQKSAVGQRDVKRYDHVCHSCGIAMHMTHEYGEAWAFKCSACKTVHVQGKDRVGGTHGAGEPEKV